MLFSSPPFFVFFAVYFAFHLLVPQRYRIYLIIAGSTVFYAWWKVDCVWLPYLLTAIAYGGVAWANATAELSARRRRVAVSVAVLFLPLIFFKYANFIYANAVGPLLGTQEKIVDLPLPLGISFVTFTLTAYIVDISRGTFRFDHGGRTALGYVLFFPHLIAGPILRPAELIPQLAYPRAQKSLAPKVAIAIFTLGLVKKLVIADPLADVVDAAYAAGHPGAPEALLAIYAFSAQIYCDFSGYTDMAIGLALLLGVRLPNNFYRPYLALSLVDFWRRWHVTLSFWFRDYVYLPLGGSHQGLLKDVRNVLVTMTLAGLWHGASWNFVIWGALHGIGISAQHIVRRTGLADTVRKTPSWLCVLVTFHVVTLAWVFFRAPTLPGSLAMLQAPFAGGGWSTAGDLAAGNMFALVLIAVFLLSHRYDDHRRVKLAVRGLRAELFWPLIALGWILAITVSHGNSAKFIYFEF